MAGAMTSPLAHRFQAILDRREHDGTLARHGNARSQSSPPPINCIARKPIKIRDPAYMKRCKASCRSRLFPIEGMMRAAMRVAKFSFETTKTRSGLMNLGGV